MKDKYKTLVSDTAIFALGNLLIKLIQFFLLPLYTIYMSTAEYGVANLLIILQSYFYQYFPSASTKPLLGTSWIKE